MELYQAKYRFVDDRRPNGILPSTDTVQADSNRLTLMFGHNLCFEHKSKINVQTDTRK